MSGAHAPAKFWVALRSTYWLDSVQIVGGDYRTKLAKRE